MAVTKLVRKIFLVLLWLAFWPFIIYFREINLIHLLRILFRGRIRQLFTREHFNLRNILRIVLATVFLAPFCVIWAIGGVVTIWIVVVFIGVVYIPRQIMGNSMKPTFNDQEIAETRSYTPISKLFYRLGRGDVVVFNSGRTIKEGNSVDYIKRVVALPNDEIEIRDGYLYINGELANESYLLKSRSTFGDDFLKECQKLKIPNGYYFVLGDNRKRSEDSRKIGLVADSEITSVLPFSEQQKFKNRWNISNGVEDWAGLPTFNPSKYYDKLNSARKERGLKPYKANARLEEAAKLRVEIILQNNELGIDSKQSKLPPERAYSEAGYYNTKTGEIRGTGYFDEEELLGYWLEYSGTQSFVFDEELQETGIAAVVGKINGCETQMIVQEFGAYIPPNYSKDTIQSWESSLSSLKEIQPGWEGLKNNLSFYDKNRADVDRITQIISIRITNITAIVGRMKANQWLAAGEQAMVDQDKALYDEQEAIAKRLNNQ